MRTWTVLSQKGGAGKTTLALVCSVESARRGQNTLLIDADPQGNAYKWAQRRAARLPDEEHLVTELRPPAGIPEMLEQARSVGCNLVVIDTPGKSDQSSLACAKLADLIVIPLRASLMDTDPILETIEIAQIAKKPFVVVVNGLLPESSGRFHEVRRAIESEYGAPVCPAFLPIRYIYQDCLHEGLCPQEYAGEYKATREIRAIYEHITSLLS